MSGLGELILRGRLVIVAGAAVVTVLAALAYAGLRVENRIDSWFASDDPQFVRYREFRDQFASESAVYVVVGADDVFAPDVLGRIDRLSVAIERLPHVVRVTSLTTIEDIVGTRDGIEVRPLVGDPDAGGPALRDRVLADPFFPTRVVSRDGRTTAVAAEVGALAAAGAATLMAGIRSAMAEVAGDGIELHLAGWPTVNTAMDRHTQHDVGTVFPRSAAVLLVCVALAFRSLRAAMLAITTVLLAIVWTMGALAGLGFEGTFVTVSALPAILLALALATVVHVVARVREETAGATDIRAAVVRALRALVLPVTITSATTAVGFGSLVVAGTPPLRQLGLFAALGMAVTCLLSLTLVPTLLAAGGGRRRLVDLPGLGPALARVAAVAVGHARAIVLVSAVATLAGAAGMLGLRPQGSTLHYLPPESPEIRAMRFIEDRFGGAGQMDVLVTGPEKALYDPAVARTVVAVARLLESYPGVTATTAYTDLVRRMNRALHDGDPAAYAIPGTREGIAQQLLLYESSGGADLEHLLDLSGYRMARVTARTTSFDELHEVERVHRDLDARLPALAPPGGPPLEIALAGEGPLWLRQNLELVGTMVRSFALALAGVALMMIWLMRSVRLGLLTMIPNVLPVILAVGCMGWSGIELDFATVTIAAVALGIAVDDTIHYVVRFRRELAVDGDPVAATHRALATVGRAMVTTSLVLCLGMAVLLGSSFPPHRTFGAIMMLTVTFALLGDLLLLPALLLRADRPLTR